jgi:hypothetical protein
MATVSTVAAEHAVASAHCAERAVGAAELEALLSAVLAEHAAYRPRAIDGVFVEKLAHTASALEARVIAVLIEHQNVEPAFFRLLLGAHGQVLPGSTLSFGSGSSEVLPYGSPAHSRLQKQLLSEPPQTGEWAHEFVRTASTWQRAASVA